VDFRHSPPALFISWGERILFAAIQSRCWHPVNRVVGGAITMKKIALLTFAFVVASYPAVAKHHFHHGQRATVSHSRISGEMVRAYVAQVGLAQAKAMAQAAGMTESEERAAVQCLEKT
jgi:hypothetical protein